MIRKFQDSDWKSIEGWWSNNPSKPIIDLLPETTYIISDENNDIACACLYLTNCKYACWIENAVANPTVDKNIRKQKVSELFKFLEEEAKRQGFKAVSIFSYIDKLKIRYFELGYMPIQNNITTFSKLI